LLAELEYKTNQVSGIEIKVKPGADESVLQPN
jgi:hypothetical protein